jgi:hypothetical protein
MCVSVVCVLVKMKYSRVEARHVYAYTQVQLSTAVFTHTHTHTHKYTYIQAVELAVAKGEMVALNKRLEALQVALNTSKSEIDSLKVKLESETKDQA